MTTRGYGVKVGYSNFYSPTRLLIKSNESYVTVTDFSLNFRSISRPNITASYSTWLFMQGKSS
jgi:ABC-type oligopeptide transport system substrate-binding subunit